MKNRKKELLFSVTAADCVFKDKRGSGKGGQKKNKTNSAIQCFHEPSGAMGEAEDHREQSLNRKLAFRRMAESTEFQVWAKLKADAAMGKVEIEEADDHGNPTKRKVRMDEI
jgi:protein subunit release factor B